MHRKQIIICFCATEIKTLLTVTFHTPIQGGEPMDTTLQPIIEIALQQGIWAAR